MLHGVGHAVHAVQLRFSLVSPLEGGIAKPLQRRFQRGIQEAGGEEDVDDIHYGAGSGCGVFDTE